MLVVSQWSSLVAVQYLDLLGLQSPAAGRSFRQLQATWRSVAIHDDIGCGTGTMVSPSGRGSASAYMYVTHTFWSSAPASDRASFTAVLTTVLVLTLQL
jgi:hypothetical protein